MHYLRHRDRLGFRLTQLNFLYDLDEGDRGILR